MLPALKALPSAGGPRRRSTRRVPPALETDVALLVAKGFSNRKVARALGVHRGVVDALVKRPETQADIEKFRLMLRGLALKSLTELADPAWGLAKACITNLDPKGFDQAMRGFSAMERIAASSSGETQPQKAAPAPAPVEDHRPAIDQLREIIAAVGQLHLARGRGGA